MRKSCHICNHPSHHQIDDLILKRISLRDIAGQFPGVSKSSLSRHKIHMHQSHRSGRPSKLTPEVQRILCGALRTGNYVENAVIYAGISKSTFYSWLAKGDADRLAGLTTILSEFSDAIKKADVDAEVRVIAQWQQHMGENWQACAEFASRRWPERWGRHKKVDMNHPAEIKQEVTTTIDEDSVKNPVEKIQKYTDAIREVITRQEQMGRGSE